MAVKKTPRVVLLDAEPPPQPTADWSAETADGWGEQTESLPSGAPVPEQQKQQQQKQKQKSSSTDPALRFHQGATSPLLNVVDDPNKTAPDEE